MRGIGNKAAADLLSGLESVRELVELPGQLAELITAANTHPVAVLALPYDPDGPQQVADPSGEGLGKDNAHNEHHHTDDDGNGTQVALDIGEQPRLVGVVFIDIDRADGDAPVHDGRGGPAAKGPVPIFRSRHVVPFQRRRHLAEQGIAILRGPVFIAVIEHPCGRVRDQNTDASGVVQRAHEGAVDIFPHRVGGQGGRQRQ